MNKRKRKGEEWTRLLLLIVEENVYYSYVGEHSQRKTGGFLGESRVDMTRLSWAQLGEREKEEGRERNQVQQPGGQRYKKCWVTKMCGLYTEEHSSLLATKCPSWPALRDLAAAYVII